MIYSTSKSMGLTEQTQLSGEVGATNVKLGLKKFIFGIDDESKKQKEILTFKELEKGDRIAKEFDQVLAEEDRKALKK
jgi:hypothetical protein